MIKIVDGNLLDCKEDIIAHQVNSNGIMGGGVARQLADKYKGLEKEYSKYCNLYKNKYENLRGNIFKASIKDKYICNIFSQKPNFETDYEAIRKAFKDIKEYAEYFNLSIAMPYKIGCGIAIGNWKIVENIILDTFNDYDVTLYRL